MGERVAADDVQDEATQPESRLIRSPQNLAAGILLVVLGGIGFFGAAGVDIGTLAEFGAGMVPRAVAVLVAVSGIALVGLAFMTPGPGLGAWPLRGLVCILGAVLAFGITLRGFDLGLLRLPPLGLAVAGPLAVALAALADPDTRAHEILILAAGLTGLCVLLFRFLLRLPIPIAPWALGY